jgi:hypothetical protein
MSIKETVFNILVDILIEARGDVAKRYYPHTKIPERNPKGGKWSAAKSDNAERIRNLAGSLRVRKAERSVDRGHKLTPETKGKLQSNMSPELSKKLGMASRDTHATEHGAYQDSIRWKRGGR